MKKVMSILILILTNNAHAQLNPATMIHYRRCQDLTKREDQIRCFRRSLLAHRLMLRTYNGDNKKAIEEKITLLEKKLKILESIETEIN